MGVADKIASMPLKIKGAIRKAFNTLAEAIDDNTESINGITSGVDLTTEVEALEALRDTGGMMVFKGTGDALPAEPKNGWVFIVNATSAEVAGAPAGATDGDTIIFDGENWEIFIVS